MDACISATTGTYSPGGYHVAGYFCPENTTTKPDATQLRTSLGDCFCDAGYGPADPLKLGDKTTAEYKFKKWLRSIPEYSGIADSQVCVPCGITRYKETVSSDSCKACPVASYAANDAPKGKKECSLCRSGFYPTPNVDIPCGKCPAGSFCVGSEPVISALLPFAGTKQSCPENSTTTEDSEENDYPFKCM